MHSVEQLLKLLQISQEFTSLKVNYDKSEICGIGSNKGAIRAFSQLRAIDLLNDSVKILGCHQSYNTDLAFERNFSDTISNISNVLNLRSLRGLSLLGRVFIFKTLGFSKIQYLAAMSEVPIKVIDELTAIQNKFIWKHSTTKIKHSTLIADSENGGIRNVDIPTKLKALKLTWVRRLRDDNHHHWKIIPSKYLSLPNGESIFIRNFKCNSDLIKKLDSLPSFYKELTSYWSEASYSTMNHVDILLTECLLYNTNVKINNSTVLYKEFTLAGINQVCHLFDKFGKLIKFNDSVDKTNLSSSLFFKWMQLIDALLPVNWKQAIKSNSSSMQSDSVSFSKYSLYSEKDSRIFTINLSCRSMYDKLLHKVKVTPTSVQYWNEKIDHLDEYVWKQIFLVPRLATIESYTSSFQYKILNNALFLNKKLFTMNLVDWPLCNLCKTMMKHQYISSVIAKSLQIFGKRFSLGLAHV